MNATDAAFADVDDLTLFRVCEELAVAVFEQALLDTTDADNAVRADALLFLRRAGASLGFAFWAAFFRCPRARLQAGLVGIVRTVKTRSEMLALLAPLSRARAESIARIAHSCARERLDFRLSDEELLAVEHIEEAAACKRTRRRATAIYRLHAGEPLEQVAAGLNVSRRSIYEWHRRWREDGAAGLACGRVSKT